MVTEKKKEKLNNLKKKCLREEEREDGQRKYPRKGWACIDGRGGLLSMEKERPCADGRKDT